MPEIENMAKAFEGERIEILKQYEILDTPPDGGLDGLTKMALLVFKVPMALVSLVATDRIWFKSHQGIEEQEVPREPGFCSSAILADDLYIVENATSDIEAMTNSLVTGKEKVKFYAGVPLKTKEGYNLGTFCILDRSSRSLSKQECHILLNMAELALNQLELRQEVRVAVKHQNLILNTTAHDLKNPLSIMPLLADLIMHHKNDPAAIDDIALQIKEAGKRMAAVIDDLLENAREEAGKVFLRLQTVELTPIVLSVVNSNSALAKNKDQSLEVDIQENCQVYADPRKLTEIIDNLINNAIKFTPFGGQISVKISSKCNVGIITVEDNGPGLTKDDMKNLFRGFTSLSARPTGGENSTGLGLSIVKNLVDAHRGTIYAFSEGKGKGATFRVEIPISESC